MSGPSAAMRVRTYLMVFGSVALSTLVRYDLAPLLGTRAAFIIYFPALVLSAWVGGWGGGLTALLLSSLAAILFFISPHHTLAIASRTDQVTLMVFVIVGLSVSAISSSQRRAQERAEAAAAEARRSELALRRE